ncbi:MAG: putative metal-binding motif-containing protein [Candidatus Zixiibacteriota bacterium]
MDGLTCPTCCTTPADADGDGFNSSVDCDDTDNSVYPGASELCDGILNDCSGSMLAGEYDDDGDGYCECTWDAGGWDGSSSVVGGDDCDDTDNSVYPGALELCDGIVNDCGIGLRLTEIDNDGDGRVECLIDLGGWDGNPSVVGGHDCDDTDETVYPGATELCDGIDNNCNSLLWPPEIDEDGDGLVACEWDVGGWDGDPSITGDGDNCHDVYNPTQDDGDGDNVGDDCDNCPSDANSDQRECPFEYPINDGLGDECDNCPVGFNIDQIDKDGNGIGDVCDRYYPYYTGVHSPVFIVLVTPWDDSISYDYNTVGWWASYEDDIDYDHDNELDDRVTIRFAPTGEYIIKVYPVSGADPGETYSLTVQTGDEPEVYIAQGVQVPETGNPHIYPYEFVQPGCCIESTGNVNCSAGEIIDISDITRLIDYLYLSHEELCCPEEADANGSGGDPDISDITRLIDFLYLTQAPLPDCP